MDVTLSNTIVPIRIVTYTTTIQHCGEDDRSGSNSPSNTSKPLVSTSNADPTSSITQPHYDSGGSLHSTISDVPASTSSLAAQSIQPSSAKFSSSTPWLPSTTSPAPSPPPPPPSSSSPSPSPQPLPPSFSTSISPESQNKVSLPVNTPTLLNTTPPSSSVSMPEEFTLSSYSSATTFSNSATTISSVPSVGPERSGSLLQQPTPPPPSTSEEEFPVESVAQTDEFPVQTFSLPTTLQASSPSPSVQVSRASTCIISGNYCVLMDNFWVYTTVTASPTFTPIKRMIRSELLVTPTFTEATSCSRPLSEHLGIVATNSERDSGPPYLADVSLSEEFLRSEHIRSSQNPMLTCLFTTIVIVAIVSALYVGRHICRTIASVTRDVSSERHETLETEI